MKTAPKATEERYIVPVDLRLVFPEAGEGGSSGPTRARASLLYSKKHHKMALFIPRLGLISYPRFHLEVSRVIKTFRRLDAMTPEQRKAVQARWAKLKKGKV